MCGCRVELATGAPEAIQAVRNCSYDVVVAESPLPGWADEEWIEELRRAAPGTPLIIRCPGGSSHDAVRLVKLGAFHFLGPEHSPEDTVRVIQEAVKDRRGRESAIETPGDEAAPWKRIRSARAGP